MSCNQPLRQDTTETALINMDNDEVTGFVFIDFRKAFDVIDHELLLKKLSIYSFFCCLVQILPV